ncbi:MAG: hypothetical protein E7652_02845 [Ruminococcaceae bacterium]|nr:hypothetical protein [Oscillospiraceae bacterium]
MNTNTKELFPLGNGCMYAVMQGLSVREIRADHFSKSFCSIEKIPESDKSDFTKSQRIHGSTHWHTRLLRVLNRDETNQQLAYVAEADDYLIANENTLIRVFNNKTTIRFKLELPEYATLTEGPVMTHDIHKAQSYFIKVRHDNYEDILQITLFGECRLDLETRTFILIPERSAMILSTGTIPGLILKSSAKALDMVIKNEISVLPLPLNEENITEVRNSVNSILSHTCTFKGIVPSSNDKYIRMLPIYTAVKLFNLINANQCAVMIASNAIKTFLGVRDCVGIGKYNEPQYATDVFALVPSLLILTAIEAPNEKLLKSMASFLTARHKIQTGTLLNGMLPFEGREYFFDNFCSNTDGSAVSTLFYIKSAELLCQFRNDKNSVRALSKVRESFRESFIKDSKIYLNSPKRTENVTLPRYIYGKCDFCNSSNFTWLTKNSVGAYCCDNCSEENKNSTSPKTGVTKESYLPVLWSEYLQIKGIFTEKEIHYSQEMALASLDSIPLCDAALLLNSMTDQPHPESQRVYEFLLSKRNSLDIWYDDNGDFDCLTNALCSYAVVRYLSK